MREGADHAVEVGGFGGLGVLHAAGAAGCLEERAAQAGGFGAVALAVEADLDVAGLAGGADGDRQWVGAVAAVTFGEVDDPVGGQVGGVGEVVADGDEVGVMAG